MYSPNNNEFVLFSTEANIRMLSTKLHWCVDGTFKSVPSIYVQFFSIHAFEGDKLIPLSHCLLSVKTRVMYSQVFRSLRDKTDSIDVLLMLSLFTCDFKKWINCEYR